jgi:histidine triad (HIT) family protein
MSDCLFCKIAAAQIPVSVVAETKSAMAFRDIDPQAPTHVLVIPREHFANAQEIAKADPNLAGELLALATQVADQEGLINGYRIVTNTGTDGGQSVGHIHFHVLGGRSLTWPPG